MIKRTTSHIRMALAIVAGVLVFLGSPAPPAHARPSIEEGFADLSEKLLPSVVNISTTQETRRGPERFPPFMFNLPPGSPFEDFFQEFNRNFGGESPKPKAHSLGSGFIIDSEGYVVTNHHVIANATEIKVIMQDNSEFEAEVVGRDEKTDIALLKIDSDEAWPAVSFGDSDKTRVGDWVLAIGNPFGLGGTVTAGIISARARDINAGPYDDFLQTDAPINSGNSGGPLFNLDGEVIGINTAIFSPHPSGGSVGIGFAVPSKLAQNVVDQLKKLGHIQRGWLGVRIQSVTPEIAESLRLDDVTGTLISEVEKGQPAERSGIRAGDIILEFNEQTIDGPRKLQRVVAETKVNTEVDVTIWRDGARKAITVEVGNLEKHEKANLRKKRLPQSNEDDDENIVIDDVGIELAPLSQELRQRYRIAADVNGAVIVNIKRQSPAAKAGLNIGNVIVGIGQSTVRGPKDIEKHIDRIVKQDKKVVLFLVRFGETNRYLALKLDN